MAPEQDRARLEAGSSTTTAGLGDEGPSGVEGRGGAEPVREADAADRPQGTSSGPFKLVGLVFLLPALIWIALRVADLAGAGPGSVGAGLGWVWTAVLVAAAAIIALVAYRMLSRS